MIDLRNKQCVGKYKGGAGSIRCVQCHPTKSLVVSCGLDRYVRVHDLRTRALLNKVSVTEHRQPIAAASTTLWSPGLNFLML